MPDFDLIALHLNENLQILLEREAKYAGNAPLDLLNQIADHRTAIELTRQAGGGELTEADWREQLRPLLVNIRERSEQQAECGVAIGDVSGDVANAIIAGRDVNLEQKAEGSYIAQAAAGGVATVNITNIYQGQTGEPKPVEKPPQPGEPETMIEIPAGPFTMGSNSGEPHEGPQHQLSLPAYAIGKFPVTNAEYHFYVKQTRTTVSPKAGWELASVGQAPPPDKLDHPVVGVSWDEAAAYCVWLSQVSGRRYRLPTEAEWEKAARGADDARCYPWGDDFAPDRCNTGSRDTAPVTAHAPAGNSPFGCADMAGNVWEWTQTMWGQNKDEPDYSYPTPEQDDGRTQPPPDDAVFREYRICRGGSYKDKPARLRCASRARVAADSQHPRRGFRVVCEL